MKNTISILVLGCLLAGCQPAPQSISLGHDACAHCKMTIVEEQFAAELVTKKGKVFKFDAIECLLAFMQENKGADNALTLVRDFATPKEWQDATKCKYLISKEIPSPMGGYLSAWVSNEAAEKLKSQKGGEVHNWEEIQGQFAK